MIYNDEIEIEIEMFLLLIKMPTQWGSLIIHLSREL